MCIDKEEKLIFIKDVKDACKEGVIWFAEKYGKDSVTYDQLIMDCPSVYIEWIKANLYKFRLNNDKDALVPFKELKEGELFFPIKTIIGKNRNYAYDMALTSEGGYFSAITIKSKEQFEAMHLQSGYTSTWEHDEMVIRVKVTECKVCNKSDLKGRAY